MFSEQTEWVILGVTETGEAFDVPDWPDRLCGMLAKQGRDKRMSYSDYLQPVHISNHPAVVVDTRLARIDPEAFDIAKKFAAENRLKTRPGRSGNATGRHPAFVPERRQYARG